MEDGSYLWEDNLALLAPKTAIEQLSTIKAEPSIFEGKIFVVAQNGRLASYDLNNSKMLWEQSISGNQVIWIAGSSIFAISDKAELICLRKVDGSIRWITKLPSKIDQNLSYAWRLNIRAASKKLGNLTWEDIRLGKQTVPVGIIGDVVLARKDIPTSYHLSATLDDHIQRIGLVTRGEDLVSATHIHKIIQVLLGLNSPKYFHHPLILDSNGERLSKRTRAQTVKSLKASGLKREDVIDLLGKENVINHIEYIHDNVSLKKKIKNNEIQLSFSMNALSKEYFLIS